MHALAQKLLKTIRKQELVRAGDRVAVAVSGGADSVALLSLLVELRRELGIVLSVAHVNHKLRGAESDEDQRFVAALAEGLGLELAVHTAPVERKGSDGIESTARRLRYEFFRKLADEKQATKIATAHTLDDQAETVLLRMFRGTGIRGLAGIRPWLRLPAASTQYPVASARRPTSTAQHKGSQGPGGSHPNLSGESLGTGYRVLGTGCEVVRPVLSIRRAELRDYLRSRGEPWREDSSNEDVAFLRNRVRQRLLPVIVEEFGEAAIEHLAELAEIARAEEEWTVSTQDPVPSTQQKPGAGPRRRKRSDLAEPDSALDVEQLLALPLAAARRALRAWIEANAPEVSVSFRLIEELLNLARGPAGKRVELPGRADVGEKPGGADVGEKRLIVRRGRKQLVLEADIRGATGEYEYELAVPGEVAVPELHARIEARVVDVDLIPAADRDGLLDPERLAKKVVIRNWRAGDRYWPAHTSSERKIKELLADRHATGVEKKLWPVAVTAGELVWMRGFAVPEKWRARAGKAIWIREIAGMM